MSITALLLCGAPDAQAVDRFWTNSGTGNWNVTANWDVFPTAADAGRINNGGTALIDASQAVTAQFVILGDTNGANGTLNMTGGSLTTSSDIRVGNNITVTGVGTSGGTGLISQSGGDILLNGGNVNIGFGDTAVGTYNISGGSLLINVGGIFAVGNRGVGIINQSGGSIYARTPAGAAISQVNLGRNGAVAATNPGRSSGSYTLSAGSLTAGSLRYGNNALGAATGSTNVFNLQGGSLTVSNIAIINTAAANSFNFTGGTLTTASVGLSLTNNGGTLNPASLFFGNSTTASPLTAAQVVTAQIGTITFTGTVGYNQSASGTLAIDLLDGTATGKDFIDIGAGVPVTDAIIAGTISVTLLGGFNPALGSTFDILTADSVTYSGTVNGLTPSGFGFEGSALADAGGDGRDLLRLTVVPEPSVMALVAISAVVFFLRRTFRITKA